MLRLALAIALLLPLQAAVPAFPGAEGFGSGTPGGRGGKVLVVTTLADSGPGSLRAALESRGPRMVLFAVSGLIELKQPLVISEPFLTVAGQSAPGEGICLKGSGLQVKTHDVILRYLRSRPGDLLGQEVDAIAIGGDSHDVIIDHCSASWSVDECLSPSGGISNVTVQWCLIGESLNASVHAKGSHGYGSLVRAVGGLSMHHNLWVKNVARNPRLGDNYGRPPFPVFDIRNNVMALWGGMCSGMAGDHFSANYVGNYLRPGPESSDRAPIVLTDTAEVDYYLAGNVIAGRSRYDRNGIDWFDTGKPKSAHPVTLAAAPFEAPAVRTATAAEAYEMVLSAAGATLPVRDSVDARIISEVCSGKGRIINSQKEVGGWPTYAPAKPDADADGDGIPDAWERAHGLNPRDQSDGARLTRDGYTNLEHFLNSIAAKDLR